MTKTKTTIYWAATLFVAFIMSISGALALLHAPAMVLQRSSEWGLACNVADETNG